MSLHASPNLGNEVLSALPPAEMALLRPLLTRVRWVGGQALHEAGERIEQVFFVEQGLVSVVAQAEGGGSGPEIGLIGREGMVGLPVLLSPGAASYSRAVARTPGSAFRMSAEALHGSLATLPVLRQRLFRALEVSMAQVAQTLACNSQHGLPQRLTRRLLMAHDRVDGDEVALTQESLATMLGVRRSGVTVALASLRAAGLVRPRWGRVVVCDRPGLEGAACGCYGRLRAFATAVAARNPDPVADLAA